MPFFFFVHTPELLRIAFSSSSGRTARLLSLAVLILSLAPWGSMYAIWWNNHTSSASSSSFFGGTMKTQPKDNNSVNIKSNADQANNTMTLEDLWYALFFGYSSETAAQHPLGSLKNQQKHSFFSSSIVGGGRSILLLQSSSSSDHQYYLLQHWKITVPWLVFFFFGVVIPTYLSIWSVLRHRQRRGYFGATSSYYYGDSAKQRRRRRERYEKAVHLLERYTKRLTPEDQVVVQVVTPPPLLLPSATTSSSSSAPVSTAVTSTTMAWKLPRPGRPLLSVSHDHNNNNNSSSSSSSSASSSYLRQLPLDGSSCAICLNSYQLQDRVVWSPNSQCVHVFHHACLLEWFLKSSSNNNYNNTNNTANNNNNNKEHLCPCCRQPYCRVVMAASGEGMETSKQQG